MQEDLRIGNRTAYFRKAITAPAFDSDSVLTRDAFSYVSLWLARHPGNNKEAISYWNQSRELYAASKSLSAVSSPLTLYYCYLNAVKALLTVKGHQFRRGHGMSGRPSSSKRELVNESTRLRRDGIIVSLSQWLGERETRVEHDLKDMLLNMPFVHRAYCLTYTSQANLFLPIQNPRYVIDTTSKEVCFEAELKGKFVDGRFLRSIPSVFDWSIVSPGRAIVRSKASITWTRRGSSQAQQDTALGNLRLLHRLLRGFVSGISAPMDLWYIRRELAGSPPILRYGPTLMLVAMHRLSELSRYDPQGLATYLSGKRNFLLSEFVELSPSQFIDEIACELTGQELRMPGVRP